MKTSWDWFTKHGDDLLAFLCLCAIALQGQVNPTFDHWLTVASIIGAVAHKVFFPNAPALPALPKEK